MKIKQNTTNISLEVLKLLASAGHHIRVLLNVLAISHLNWTYRKNSTKVNYGKERLTACAMGATIIL